MSKKKNTSCCNECCCCNPCCCPNKCCSMTNYGGFGNFGGLGNNCDSGILEAIVFWLIACGAGLLNTNSILIILLFILYGWSCDNGCGSGIFG